MKEFEFTAKTLEQAIEKGLEELKVNQEDVDIEVLSEGGLFQKAKIIIRVEEDEEEISTSTITGDDLVISKNKEKTPKKVKAEKIEKKQKEEKPQPETADKESFEELFNQSIKTGTEMTEEKFVEIDADSMPSVAFLKGLLNQLNIVAEIKTYKGERGKKISIIGENAGNIIGHRGEGLNSIQTLVNAIETKTDRKADRVFIDIESYKERRVESLKALAHRIAKNVVKSQRRHRLDPMNSYERRIIHTELQNNPKIRTYSCGEEPNRYLVIEYIR